MIKLIYGTILFFLFITGKFEKVSWIQISGSDVEKASQINIQPNILLILAEDHSAQLGSYGDEYVRTPTLDRLAADGIRFENAYVTQAGCSPSRASILTGLYPHQHGQIGLATHKMQLFNDDIPNMPALLGEYGYRTGNIGKIHVDPESVFRFDYHRNLAYNQFGTRDMRAIAQETEGFIRNTGDLPFYLQINYSDAHLPFLRRQFGLPENPYTAEEIGPLPFVGLNSPESLEQTADYYSCITRIDDGVALLLEVLEKTGKYENTLVIYLSDHGAPVPRGKMTSYEGGVHVPLIMWMPENIQQGLVRNHLVSTVDLMPTVLDYAGISLPEGLAGTSLRPIIDNENAHWREYLFTEFTLHWPKTFFPQRTVRDERYKLIVNMLPDTLNPIYEQYMITESLGENRWWAGRNPYAGLSPEKRAAYALWENPSHFELYDLQEDRWEWNNLSDLPENEEIQVRLLGELRKWQKTTGDELRNLDKLDDLKKEVAGTFFDGGYIHVRNRPEFEWRYIEYLQP